MHCANETGPADAARHSTTFKPFKISAVAGACVLAAMLLAACGDKKEGQPAAHAGAQKPPEVSVMTVKYENVPVVADLPGRLDAYRVAQVRARAAGILEKRLFREGSDVKAGQVLFQIDNSPLKASLQSAEATLAQAQANFVQAAATAKRYKPLVEANAISKQDYDNAVAAEKAAQAQVAAGKAAVANANINLGYAAVTAPISGRIGRALVTEGALVGQGEATQLAVIQQINPLYVNVTQSSGDILRMREALKSGKLTQAGDGAAKVEVYTEDGRENAHEGKLLFTGLTVGPTPGQVTVRAELPNPEALLLPGMYVRVRLEQAQVDNAVLVPQQAVTRNEKGNIVMIVGDDGSVSPRPVQIGQSKGSNWVVTSGLKPDEKVMIDGFIKLGMGAKKVTPVEWQADKTNAGTSQPSKAAGAADAGDKKPDNASTPDAAKDAASK